MGEMNEKEREREKKKALRSYSLGILNESFFSWGNPNTCGDCSVKDPIESLFPWGKKRHTSSTVYHLSTSISDFQRHCGTKKQFHFVVSLTEKQRQTGR